jgi:NADH:quinone reductase (non-electrogenic)
MTRVVVVGAGFLYLPLLPEVAGGVLDPRRVAVSVAGTLPRPVASLPVEADDVPLTSAQPGG